MQKTLKFLMTLRLVAIALFGREPKNINFNFCYAQALIESEPNKEQSISYRYVNKLLMPISNLL